jgi:hypothetical protein
VAGATTQRYCTTAGVAGGSGRRGETESSGSSNSSPNLALRISVMTRWTFKVEFGYRRFASKGPSTEWASAQRYVSAPTRGFLRSMRDWRTDLDERADRHDHWRLQERRPLRYQPNRAPSEDDLVLPAQFQQQGLCRHPRFRRAATAVAARRPLSILYDPNDLSGAAIGCLNADCRLIQSVELFRD